MRVNLAPRPWNLHRIKKNLHRGHAILQPVTTFLELCVSTLRTGGHANTLSNCDHVSQIVRAATYAQEPCCSSSKLNMCVSSMHKGHAKISLRKQKNAFQLRPRENRHSCAVVSSASRVHDDGMDSHGGLEVTIRQTESKKKKTTQQLRETDP